MAKREQIVCKLTGVKGPSVDAHIIPRALFQLDGKPAKVISAGEEHYREQRSQLGPYDPTILTQEGESYFSDCDDFAAKFFLNRRDYNIGKTARITTNKGIPIIAEIDEPNLELLKFFCLSVLWRASVSSQNFFRNVNLGLWHEQRLKEMILAGSSGEKDEYSVILMRHIDTPEYGLPILAPDSDRLDGIRGYRFNLPQASFVIKADKRPLPPDYRPMAIGHSSHLRVIMLDPYKSGDQYRILRKHLASGPIVSRNGG